MSLSEVSAAGVRLTPAEASAIVTDICRQITRGTLRGVPSPNVIRIGEDGTLTAEGPVGADRATVARAAKLLESLLGGPDAPQEYRAPGPLRLVLARAQGALDVPAFAGLDAFCVALARFALPDLRPAARDLYAAWTAATAPSALPVTAAEVLPAPAGATSLTISDVRRARRATGLTLADVAERSRVPAPLLLELEWGYLRNWPAGFYGRAQLVRYARAAGLDERLVLEAAWPLLEEAIEHRGGEAVVPAPATRPFDELIVVDEPEPAADIALVPALRAVPPAPPAPARWKRWGVALAIPAAMAVAVAPAIIQRELRVEIPVPAATVTPHHAVARDGRPSRTPRRPRRPPIDREPIAATRPIRENATYPPSFSTAGSAVFFPEGADMLKITRVVDENARNFHARPSPDGRLIAFDSDRDGIRGVYVATSDGAEVRRVSGQGFAALPSWSPDGRQLAFVKAEPGMPDVWNLWTADLSSGDLRRLTSYTEGQPWGGSWFPDGHRIAYSHDTELIVLDLATGQRRTFDTPKAGRPVRTPSVSPDGRRIIFQVSRDGVWLLDVARGTMRRVLDDPSAEEYTWSPDGRRVAFHSHRSGGWGVWVMGR